MQCSPFSSVLLIVTVDYKQSLALVGHTINMSDCIKYSKGNQNTIKPGWLIMLQIEDILRLMRASYP